jgi:hypothetical protein
MQRIPIAPTGAAAENAKINPFRKKDIMGKIITSRLNIIQARNL